MKARVITDASSEDEIRVAFDAGTALIRPDTNGVGVRVILDLDPGEFRDLLAVLVAEHRRRDGSE